MEKYPKRLITDHQFVVRGTSAIDNRSKGGLISKALNSQSVAHGPLDFMFYSRDMEP